MDNENKSFEIPFRANDSELGGWEYTIPEGFEAVIEDGKVKVRKTKSKDEKMQKDKSVLYHILNVAIGMIIGFCVSLIVYTHYFN